jgi:hypothetical protein
VALSFHTTADDGRLALDVQRPAAFWANQQARAGSLQRLAASLAEYQRTGSPKIWMITAAIYPWD